MNKRIKKLWVNALQSGEYSQCKSQLKDNSGYCCLGVAQDLFYKEKGIPKWENNVKFKANITDSCEEWLELPVYIQDRFAELNDVDKLTFEEIALYIKNGL